MAPLAAAQVENAVVALEPDAADQQIDFIGRVPIVLDYIAVGFEVERVEQGAPPIGRQVTFEIRDRTQCSRSDAPVRLGMVEIRAGCAGVGGVWLGGRPHTVGFLPHIAIYLGFPEIKKAASRGGSRRSGWLVGMAVTASEAVAARSSAGIGSMVASAERLYENCC